MGTLQKIDMATAKKSFVGGIKRFFTTQWPYLFLIAPGVLLLFAFSYLPMFGIVLAFKNFRIQQGIWGSPWLCANPKLYRLR